MLALLCAAQFMVVLDFSIVNVALPSIQREFGLSQERLQWLVSAYALTFGGFLLLGGRAADLFGRRRMFIVGLVLFACASLLGGIAPNAVLLIAARALQGVAAAVLSPAALSLVTSIFSHGRERHRALGTFSALGAGGFAMGVFLGGLLTDGPGWRWVFFVNVPVGITVALLSPRVFPDFRPSAAQRHLDLPGAVTATLGLGTLVFGLTQAPNWGWTSGWRWACITLAFICLAVFAAIERRTPAPLLRLGLLRKRSVAVTNTVILLTTASVAPQVFVLSLYLQTVEGFSAIQTGLLFLVQGATAVFGAVLGSRVVSAFGVRPLLIGGRLAAALALLLLTPLQGSLGVLLPALALLGLGNVCTFIASSVGATSEVEPGELGLASGVLYAAQQVGAALGISILIALAATRTSIQEQAGVEPSAALIDGFRFALGGGAVLSFAAAIIGLAAPGRLPSASE
jgi:EmrB/QacA subfamily drug resistance transporter